MPTPSSRSKSRNSPGTAISESCTTTTTMSSPSTSHKKRTHTLSNIFKRLSDHSSQDSESMKAPLSPSAPLGPFSSPSQRSNKSLRKSLSMRISRTSNDHVNDAMETSGKANGNGSSTMAKSTSVPNRLSDRRTFTLNGQPLDLSQMPQLPPVQPLKAPKTKRQELEHVRRKLVGGLHSGNSGSRSRHFDDDDDNDNDDNDDNSEIYDEEDEDEMSVTKDTNGDEIPQKTRLYLANDNLDTASPSSSGQQNGHHGIFNSNRLGKTLSKKHISKTSLRMQSSTPNQSLSSVTNHNDGEPIEYDDKVEEVEAHSTERSGLFSTLMNTFNLRSFTDLTNHGTNNHVDFATDQEETDEDDKSTYDDEDHNNDQKSKEVSLSSSQQQATNDVLSKVSFVPLKKPLISTIGKGNLTLDSFPKNQTQLPSDDGMNKITMHEASNAQQSVLRANTLANGHSPLIDDKLSSLSPPNINLEQPTGNRSSISSDEIGHAIATTNFKSPNSRLSKPRRSLSPGSRRGTIRNSLTSILSSDDDANGNGNGASGELSSIPMTNSLSFKRKLKIPLAGKRISLDLPMPCTTTNDENVNETPVSLSKRRDALFEKLNVKPPSEKRQESFHNLFPNLPIDETIIEDFTCAFRKEILVQGKLYLTEHYICFHSNIIGLVTRFAIPLNAILKMQKKRTVGIPNAIEFSNLHNKYIFASFLSRDQTYDLIHKVWKMNIRKDGFDVIDLDIDDNEVDSMDSGSIISTDDEDNVIDDKNNASVNQTLGPDDDADTSDTSISDQENMVKDGDTEGANAGDAENAVNDAQIFNGFTFEGPKTHAATSNGYTADSSDIKITDEIIKAPLGVVYALLFGDDISFVKNLLKAQKNYDIGDIPKFNAKKRVYTYTKPINGGPVGPKQTKCIVEEEIQHKDFESYCLVQQLTESPDVPSGNSFKVKTKIYLSWAPNNSTKLFVITSFVWTGKSWIKGAIEKGGISGQKEALGIMVSELKKRILAGGGSQGGAVGSIKRKDKKNRKGKDEITEAADESQTLEEEEPEVIPEVPKTFMDLILDQLDLKLVLIVLLFILVVSDKFSRHKKPSGYELYSSDRMLMSESNLWEWIEQREHVLPRCIPGESQECSAMSKLAAKKHSESMRSSAKRKISQQNLKSTIDLMEQELAALKAKTEGYEAVL